VADYVIKMQGRLSLYTGLASVYTQTHTRITFI